MPPYQVDRGTEQFLEKYLQAEHQSHLRRHVDADVDIAVRPVVSSGHGAEYTQGFNAKILSYIWR